MRKYVCPHCGFHSLVDPGEKCPGCGYLISYMNNHAHRSRSELRRSEEEVAIRRLRCAALFSAADNRLGECTITSKGLRFSFDGTFKDGSFSAMDKRIDPPQEMTIPYDQIRGVFRPTHMGCPARYFVYRTADNRLIALWYFVDRGIAVKCPDIDDQVKEMVKGFLAYNTKPDTVGAVSG